jgi:hypothetical protein
MRLGPDFISQDKQMTAYEAQVHLRLVRYLQVTALRGEGKTLAEIGLLFGVSRQRVNQLLKPPGGRPGRPRRAGPATHSQEERETVLAPPAYRYRLQVRDKFTYLGDAFEIGFLVNSLLHGPKPPGNSLANDSNPMVGSVNLSDISITLEAIKPTAVERVWYSPESMSVVPPAC